MSDHASTSPSDPGSQGRPGIQLRRYELVPETQDEFIAWFPKVIPARAAHGFRVLFAVLDAERHEFTWAVAHDGDFAAAEQVYMVSPERAAAFAGVPKYTAAQHISMVTDVLG
jgi:hypothetical protein